VKRLVKETLAMPFGLLPARVRRELLRLGLYAASRGVPADALRLLLALDKHLSGLIDETAMRYEGGVHPKHRLTGYHDFFVERVKPGERVLDVGCGYGAVAHSVATRARADVVGIDIDPENIAEARRRFGNPTLTFVVGDVTRDLPGGGFDVIVASNVIEHLERRVDFYRSLQARLRPRCWLVRLPLVDRDWRVALRRELGLPFFSDPTHHTEYTRESFEAEVRAAGLTVTSARVNWGEVWAELGPEA
jgi:2-polyprenyl-3-methyl-5-hydroxy-6-metoxy-1,4-benzoquinol methylase